MKGNKSEMEKRKEAQELILKGLNKYFGDEGQPITAPLIKNKRISIKDLDKKLSPREVDNGTVAFLLLNNISAGSALSYGFDLYKVLRSYILNPELRNKINQAISD